MVLLLALAFADEHASANVAGMGGSSVADPTDLTAIRTNPAAVGLTERYDIQALFGVSNGRDLRWGIAAGDSRTNDRVSFGLAYMGGLTRPPFLPEELPPFAVTGEEPENKKQRHDIELSLSVPLLDRRLAFGLGGNLLIYNQTWNGKGVTGNLAAGVAARPIDELSLGIGFRDLLPIAEQPDRPATMNVGARGGVEDIVVASGELGYRLEKGEGSPLTGRLGVQGTIDFVQARAGWTWDGPLQTHLVTWGIGASADAGSIDYAMQIPVNQPGLRFADLIHTLTITLRTNAFKRESSEEEPGDGAPMQWPGGR
ncbi:MAG TPA: hypothetical protein PKA64_05740 [Myxococcota bacterium]|nr:hypothetical protein [Myxococcota bacterium]